MWIENIEIPDKDFLKLLELLSVHNKSLPIKDRLTPDQYLEQLIKDAIYFKYKLYKAEDKDHEYQTKKS